MKDSRRPLSPKRGQKIRIRTVKREKLLLCDWPQVSNVKMCAHLNLERKPASANVCTNLRSVIFRGHDQRS